MAFDGLSQRYGERYPLLHRRGSAYPVTTIQFTRDRAGGSITLMDSPAPVDEELRSLGEAHLLEMVRSHRMFNGPIVALVSIEPDKLIAASSEYFAMVATCDALRAEYLRGPEAQPMRNRADRISGSGGPVVSGQGRAAGVGVSVIVTFPRKDGRAFVIGLRRPDLALDGGRYHVVPSGMVESTATSDVLLASVHAELEEELSVVLTEVELDRRLQPLGVAVDLLRLRPEVCMRLDLDSDEADGLFARDEEFSAARLVELSAGGLDRFWAEHGPDRLTPAAAGAVALLERSLTTYRSATTNS